MITYPLNNIDYTAEDAELFHCTRTSGIWAKDSFPISVTGADNNVTIGTGIAWINNKKFSGKVAALKSAKVLNLGIADSTYPRIDVIAIQYSANNNATDVVIKKGTPATNPVLPTIVRSDAVYELYLASVYRPSGATTITAPDITDLRRDKTVCGLMADSVTSIDTSAINSQVKALIQKLAEEIEGVKDTSGLMFENDWVDSSGKIPASKLSVGGIRSGEFFEELLFTNVKHLTAQSLDFDVIDNKSIFIPGALMVIIDIGVRIDGAIDKGEWVSVCKFKEDAFSAPSRGKPLNAAYSVIDGTKRFSAVINSNGTVRVCAHDGVGTNSNFTLNIAGVYIL